MRIIQGRFIVFVADKLFEHSGRYIEAGAAGNISVAGAVWGERFTDTEFGTFGVPGIVKSINIRIINQLAFSASEIRAEMTGSNLSGIIIFLRLPFSVFAPPVK